jgi:hypothetical protein
MDKRGQCEGSSAMNGEPAVRNKANWPPLVRPNHQLPGTATGGRA